MGVGRARVMSLLLLLCAACDAGEKQPRRTEVVVPRTCVEAITWSPVSTTNAPPASERLVHAVVDDKLLVVGYAPGNTEIFGATAGALLDPCTNTWTPIDTTGIPSQLVPYGSDLAVTRAGPYAVWFYPGTETSLSPYDATSAAAVFDSTARRWTTLPLTGPLATPRTHAASAWTGKELIVFGGTTEVKQPGGGTKPAVLGDGVAIDLARGTLRVLATTGAPSPRSGAHAAWTNGRVVISGGCRRIENPYTNQGCTEADGGAQYDPTTDTWSPLLDATLQRGDAAVVPAGPPQPDRTFMQVRARVGAFDVVWGRVSEQRTGRVVGCDGEREPGQGCDPYEETMLVPRAEGWRMQNRR
jgi:hypothetical protein